MLLATSESRAGPCTLWKLIEAQCFDYIRRIDKFNRKEIKYESQAGFYFLKNQTNKVHRSCNYMFKKSIFEFMISSKQVSSLIYHF